VVIVTIVVNLFVTVSSLVTRGAKLNHLRRGSRVICSSLLLLLMFLPVFSWSQGTGKGIEEIITLEQAIDMSLESNRQVKNAAMEVTKTKEQIAAARTRRLPMFFLSVLGARLLQTATFEFPAGSLGTFPGIGAIPARDTSVDAKPQWGVYGSAMVAQPLSQQYRIGLSIDLLVAGHAIAVEKLRQQQHGVVKDVKHSYYEILQLQISLAAAKEAVIFYREFDRVVEEHVREKTAMKGESMEVKTRLLKAEKDVLTLTNSIASRKEQLNRLLGRDIRTRFAVSPVPEPAPFETDLDQADTKALAQRPEVKEARLKVKAAEYDRSIKKSEYIPDVSLAFNYMSVFSVPVLPSNVMTAGFLLTWDVFDWGRKNRELAEKALTIEQAHNGVREAESLVLLDVNHQFRKLEEARADIKASTLGLETAKENRRVTTNKYKEKTALLKDVLEAETNLAEANRQFQKSLLSAWTAKADFEKAMGEEYKR
jgi:outer membrane protein